MCELTQKWYRDGEKTETAKAVINIMDSLKVSIDSAMQTEKNSKNRKNILCCPR